MKVITVKFADGGKNYDYLLLNPKGVIIDSSQQLRECHGCTSSGPCYTYLHVCAIYEVDYLPSWVTSQMVLDSSRDVIISHITTPSKKDVKNSKASIVDITNIPQRLRGILNWTDWYAIPENIRKDMVQNGFNIPLPKSITQYIRR